MDVTPVMFVAPVMFTIQGIAALISEARTACAAVIAETPILKVGEVRPTDKLDDRLIVVVVISPTAIASPPNWVTATPAILAVVPALISIEPSELVVSDISFVAVITVEPNALFKVIPLVPTIA